MKYMARVVARAGLLCVGAVAWAAAAAAAAAGAGAASRPATTRPGVRIALVGDSTVTDGSGWGRGFARSLNEKSGAVCLNFARNGRSSKSYRAEGHWAKVLEAKPDYALIQFGHNDCPGKGPDRETDPSTTYRANMERYVDEARAAGIRPVLVTSLCRRRWGKDGHIHSDLQAYADVVKEVAAERHVPLIDLHDRSIDVYESLGPAGCELLSPTKDGGYDGTHLNAAGSDTFGTLVAADVRHAVPELKPYVRGYIQPPGRAPATRSATAPVVPFPAKSDVPLTHKGERTIAVAADGGGDFRTVQEAIAAAPEYNADRTTIRIGPGVYRGQFLVPPSKPNLSVVGEDAATTVLTYSLNVYDPIPPGVPERLNGNGTVIMGDGFRAERVTFRNTSGDHGQAMALRVDGDRCEFVGCRLLGWQDTLLCNAGRQYFRDCYIEGRVDFIYGAATAVFDRCEIQSKDGGHITAASTPEDHPYGLVFLDCRLTGEAVPTDLGRPWRPYGSVTYVRCEMGPHIIPQGWNNWGKESNEKTARFAEFRSTGPGANPGKRAPWSRQLTAEEAAHYTVGEVLGGGDHWEPAAAAAR